MQDSHTEHLTMSNKCKSSSQSIHIFLFSTSQKGVQYLPLNYYRENEIERKKPTGARKLGVFEPPSVL